MDDNVKAQITLSNAIGKLIWSAGGEWSANLRPDECKALLDALDPYLEKTRMATGTIDAPPSYQGDPGDESDHERSTHGDTDH